MTAATETGRDVAGVELALFEMMEQSLGRMCQQSLRNRLGAGASDQALAAFEVKRTLPDGYYNWGSHLMQLEAALAAGITLRAEHLWRDEMSGLVSLRRARAKFEEKHPSCPHCGLPRMDSYGPCAICGKDSQS